MLVAASFSCSDLAHRLRPVARSAVTPSCAQEAEGKTAAGQQQTKDQQRRSHSRCWHSRSLPFQREVGEEKESERREKKKRERQKKERQSVGERKRWKRRYGLREEDIERGRERQASGRAGKRENRKGTGVTTKRARERGLFLLLPFISPLLSSFSKSLFLSASLSACRLFGWHVGWMAMRCALRGRRRRRCLRLPAP